MVNRLPAAQPGNAAIVGVFVVIQISTRHSVYYFYLTEYTYHNSTKPASGKLEKTLLHLYSMGYIQYRPLAITLREAGNAFVMTALSGEITETAGAEHGERGEPAR